MFLLDPTPSLIYYLSVTSKQILGNPPPFTHQLEFDYFAYRFHPPFSFRLRNVPEHSHFRRGSFTHAIPIYFGTQHHIRGFIVGDDVLFQRILVSSQDKELLIGNSFILKRLKLLRVGKFKRKKKMARPRKPSVLMPGGAKFAGIKAICRPYHPSKLRIRGARSTQALSKKRMSTKLNR